MPTTKKELLASKKSYNSMNASEKTAYLGVKIFSDREIAARQRDAMARRVPAGKKLLEAIIANPNFTFGKHLSEQQLEPAFKDAINEWYDWALKEAGLTPADLTSVIDGIIQIAYMLKRTENEANLEVQRFNFAVTGENELGNVPLRDMAKIAQLFNEKKENDVIDDTPDEVVADEVLKDDTAAAPAPIVGEAEKPADTEAAA